MYWVSTWSKDFAQDDPNSMGWLDSYRIRTVCYPGLHHLSVPCAHSHLSQCQGSAFRSTQGMKVWGCLSWNSLDTRSPLGTASRKAGGGQRSRRKTRRKRPVSEPVGTFQRKANLLEVGGYRSPLVSCCLGLPDRALVVVSSFLPS